MRQDRQYGSAEAASKKSVIACVNTLATSAACWIASSQPLAVRRSLDLIGAEECRRSLTETHGAAIHYSQAAQWGDSSNKLSWLIPDLAGLFPEARFVHLVRDGRKAWHKIAPVTDQRLLRVSLNKSE